VGKISKYANILKNQVEEEIVTGFTDDTLLQWLGIDRKNHKNINEATYYTCLKLLSETMGKLPLKFLRAEGEGYVQAEMTPISYLLTVRPNRFTSPTNFWTALEMNTQHFGNGYAWLRGYFRRDGGYTATYDVKDIWLLPSNCVRVTMDDAGIFGDTGEIYYEYDDPKSGRQYIFRRTEIMHFKTWYSFDGIMGAPVGEILKGMIDGTLNSQEFLANLYKNGVTARYAMQYTGDLDKERREKLKAKFADKLTGPENAGKVVPVPKSLTLTPLEQGNLANNQYMELKKYSAQQIAAAFGIKPTQLNDYEKSSYANAEMQQLSFLVDTMLYRIRQYEDEINYICLTHREAADGYVFKFNEKVLLRTDSKSQMEMLAQGVNNGIYTPNEARGYLNMPAKPGGDQLMMNGNYIPVTQVGQQYGNVFLIPAYGEVAPAQLGYFRGVSADPAQEGGNGNGDG